MKKTPKATRPAKKSKACRTADALQIIDKMIGRDASMRKLIDEATLNSRVAQMIYDARTKAHLTQTQLAKLVGTTQSVIARLEDADYEGHSLSMLARIAATLDQEIEMRFV
jgi:ribosome-binding protein aMBF1 (putative translation factor)